MFVILNKSHKELLVNHSRFIALTFPFNEISQLAKILNEVKETYPKAKHYLYAYKINEIEKSNDDHEVGNIARGFLDLINKKNLNKVLIIVVRYFGGVKLGASNLLRVYLKVVNDCLNDSSLASEKDVYHYQVITDYSTFNKIQKLGYEVANVQYDDKIKLDIFTLTKLNEDLINLKVKIVKEEMIKRLYEISKRTS